MHWKNIRSELIRPVLWFLQRIAVCVCEYEKLCVNCSHVQDMIRLLFWCCRSDVFGEGLSQTEFYLSHRLRFLGFFKVAPPEGEAGSTSKSLILPLELVERKPDGEALVQRHAADLLAGWKRWERRQKCRSVGRLAAAADWRSMIQLKYKKEKCDQLDKLDKLLHLLFYCFVLTCLWLSEPNELHSLMILFL